MKFLANTVGAVADTFAVSGATIHSSKDIKDLMSGPRNYYVNTDAQAGDVSHRYGVSSGDFDYDHIVIAGAWQLANCSTTLGVKVEEDTGSGYADVAGSEQTTLLNSNLIGIDKYNYGNGQDFVIDVGSTRTAEGVGLVSFKSGGSTAGADAAREISKFYACKAFTFDKGPSVRKIMRSRPIQKVNGQPFMSRPIKGDVEYEIEKTMSMSFENLTFEQIENFLAVENILRWPIFIYDENAEVWPWKLEHVIIENYKYSKAEGATYWELQLDLARLAHYVTAPPRETLPTDYPDYCYCWTPGYDENAFTLDSSGNVTQQNDWSGNGRNFVVDASTNEPYFDPVECEVFYDPSNSEGMISAAQFDLTANDSFAMIAAFRRHSSNVGSWHALYGQGTYSVISGARAYTRAADAGNITWDFVSIADGNFGTPFSTTFANGAILCLWKDNSTGENIAWINGVEVYRQSGTQNLGNDYWWKMAWNAKFAGCAEKDWVLVGPTLPSISIFNAMAKGAALRAQYPITMAEMTL